VTNGVLEKVKSMGLHTVEVEVSGIGTGRDASLRALAASGMTVNTVRDVTPNAAQRLPAP
jgi:small subunit ribosomal protein S11